jgi:hypothetical protein
MPIPNQRSFCIIRDPSIPDFSCMGGFHADRPRMGVLHTPSSPVFGCGTPQTVLHIMQYILRS